MDVLAAGVNRADLMIRRRLLPPREDAAGGLGYEFAGLVVEVGRDVRRWRPGDQVCGMSLSPAYAEAVVAAADHLLPAPAGLSPVAAAALPLASCTAWAHLFDPSILAAEDWLLLHGGASGVGAVAIQMAHARGLRIVATAGAPERVELCRALGADVAVNYRSEDFVAAALGATGGSGVDVVLDVVGGPYLERNLRCLRAGGRLLVMGFQGGWRGEVDLSPIAERLTSLACVSFSRSSPARRARIVAAVEAEVWPAVETGAIIPFVGGVFPMAEVERCHERLDSGTSAGKLVLYPEGNGRPWLEWP